VDGLLRGRLIEATTQPQRQVEPPAPPSRLPAWALGAIPLALIAIALVALLSVGGDTLGERVGPPVEEIAVERTVLRPGEIELSVRNTGPDPVTVAQAFVNDAYADYSTTGNQVGRGGTETFTLDYPWQADSPYLVTLVSETGATTEHEIPVAVETPTAGGGFYGLMALLGVYVGIIPVVLGMLFLPLLRQVREHWIRFFMAVTIGLLAFLGVDAYLEGTEIAESGTGAFGGAELLFIGAGAAYLGLVALDRFLRARRDRASAAGTSAFQLSLLVAIGIGLHNLGEGLAIGSAYAIGELALGAFLVFGFALQNTSEGLAIVAPLSAQRRPSLLRLASLGMIAGVPAILGAFIGASVNNPELAALLIGIGIGAIVQVIVQLVPTIRDRAGRALYPASVAGIFVGAALLYSTGLLISA
jgi:zinc transporter ZupT